LDGEKGWANAATNAKTISEGSNGGTPKIPLSRTKEDGSRLL